MSSVHCADKSRNTHVEKECLFCESKFKVKICIINKGGGIFCSKQCYRNAHAPVSVTCPICGKQFMRWISVPDGEGIYCSRSCFGKAHSKQISGANHPNWQGGKSFLDIDRRGPGWERRSKKVRKTYRYTCQHCGKTENELGTHFHAHHIVPYFNFTSRRKANAMTNLTCLCPSCHMKAERKLRGQQMIFLAKLY